MNKMTPFALTMALGILASAGGAVANQPETPTASRPVVIHRTYAKKRAFQRQELKKEVKKAASAAE